MYYMFYCPVFLPTGCVRKPLHTETTRQTQETGRQGHYHGKYTCTQTVGVQMHSDTVGTPALKHCGYTCTHCGHTCTETLGWGYTCTQTLWVRLHSLWTHLFSDTWGHCGYTCTHYGHTCTETLGWGTSVLRHCGCTCTHRGYSDTWVGVHLHSDTVGTRALKLKFAKEKKFHLLISNWLSCRSCWSNVLNFTSD